MNDEGLTLIGVSRILCPNSPFINYRYVKSGFFPEAQACAGVPGYAEPCPTQTTPGANNSGVTLKYGLPGMIKLICTVIAAILYV